MTDWDAYIDAVAGPLGLAIAPPWRSGVVGFLGIAAEMATVLAAVELDPDELALAPVYRLPEPSEEPR